MKKRICQIVSFILVAVLCGACGTGNSAAKRPQLNTDFSQKENSYSFSSASPQPITISNESADAVLQAVMETQVIYPYASFYQLEEVEKRLAFNAEVDRHTYTALNNAGKLDGGHLAELVKQNNDAFMATEPFGYKTVEEDYIQQLCDFIVKIVDSMQQKYPDINWSRVYCNLGNLKILYDTGMLSYAQVSQEMILAISKNNTEIILNMQGESGFSQVLTHEIMHIIQIGCGCENIDNCVRRAGIAVYWDDFSLNTTDWTWMVEGSAERHMCKLTGGEAVSYQYKMDYLCSLTMSVLLRDSVNADTIENLCFYDDPQMLFDAFGCENDQQREELLNMMITLQVLQMQPKNFHAVYKEETGVDLLEDDEAMNQFSYALKPAACLTLAKEFYQNLIPFVQDNQLSCNDLFFLINLFEGHLNQHLNFTSESKKEINKPFVEGYIAMRTALFSALEKDNPGINLTTMYAAYEITAAGEKLLNAELAMLPSEKRDFLAERAQWQGQLNGLGQKVMEE